MSGVCPGGSGGQGGRVRGLSGGPGVSGGQGGRVRGVSGGQGGVRVVSGGMFVRRFLNRLGRLFPGSAPPAKSTPPDSGGMSTKIGQSNSGGFRRTATVPNSARGQVTPPDSGGFRRNVNKNRPKQIRRIPADSGGFRRIPAELTYTGTLLTYTYT